MKTLDKVVFIAFSKKLFYFRMHLSKFVLEQGCAPINPFMLHEYFMLDTVERDTVRFSNNTLVERADELWVFGEVSDGVQAEIEFAEKLKKPIRYFEVSHSKDIKEISKTDVQIEDE